MTRRKLRNASSTILPGKIVFAEPQAPRRSFRPGVGSALWWSIRNLMVGWLINQFLGSVVIVGGILFAFWWLNPDLFWAAASYLWRVAASSRNGSVNV